MKQLRFLLLAVLCCGILPSAAQIYIVDPVGSPDDEIEAVAVTDSTLVYDKKDTLRAGDVITVVRVINNGDRAVYQTERGQFSVRGYMLKFSDDNPEGTIDKFEENYRLCIGYAVRPHLSSRLTWSGRTFLQKPEAFGHADSHCIRATHSGILTSIHSTAACATVSPRIQRSPTQHVIMLPKLRCQV